MGFPLNIGRVYIKEQASSWGTAETSFAAANAISAKVFLPDFAMEALEAETFRGGWHAHALEQGSREGAEFTIEHVLQGSSLTTPVADPVENPDALLIRSALGSGAAYGYRSNQLNSAGQTTALIKFLNNQATAAGVGMGMLVPVTGLPREITWPKTFTDGATDDFVPWLNLAAAADYNGGTNVVYGGRTLWTSLTQPTPFTAQIHLGQSDGNAGVRFRDCAVTGGKLTCLAGKQPIIAHTCKAGYWSIAGSWTPAIYANQYPELPMLCGANGSRVRYGGSATTFPGVEIEWTSTLGDPVKNLGATDAFAKYIVVEREFKVTVTELVTDYGGQIYYPGTEVATGMQIDLCNIPGRGAGVFVPTYQVGAISKDEGTGLLFRKTTYRTRITTAETAGANASQSPARIVIF